MLVAYAKMFRIVGHAAYTIVDVGQLPRPSTVPILIQVAKPL